MASQVCLVLVCFYFSFFFEVREGCTHPFFWKKERMQRKPVARRFAPRGDGASGSPKIGHAQSRLRALIYL